MTKIVKKIIITRKKEFFSKIKYKIMHLEMHWSFWILFFKEKILEIRQSKNKIAYFLRKQKQRKLRSATIKTIGILQTFQKF